MGIKYGYEEELAEEITTEIRSQETDVKLEKLSEHTKATLFYLRMNKGK